MIRSVPDLFDQVAAAHTGRPAYRRKVQGAWVDMTWDDARGTCAAIARALLALGVEKGDRVAILSQTRLEWVLADFGILGCGGVTVGIYPTNPAEDCAYVLRHSEAVVAFLENRDQLAKVLSQRTQLPALRRLVLFDGTGGSAEEALGWDAFLALGARAGDSSGAAPVARDLDAARAARREALRPEDLAAIVYTSGTTGVPKGVMLTHANMLFISESTSDALPLDSKYISLLILPLAHVFARLCVLHCLRNGVPVAFAENMTKVAENLIEIRPHFTAVVPRVLEKVHEKIQANVREASALKRRLFEWAHGVGARVSKRRLRGEALSPWLSFQHAVAERLIFRKVQAALGGRIEFVISGAAPLDPRLGEFFHAFGIVVLEGIGMTENTSFSNVNRRDRIKFGTVGPVGRGIEMKIAPDGEVLFRGPNVMRGYFKDPEATAAAIDAEGWLHSGDVGTIDEDGYLKITDRKKDLIVTSGGKNVAPQRVEAALKRSPYISQAVAFGDKRKFITALVTLDPEQIRKWARANGRGGGNGPEPALSDLAEDREVQALIETEVASANERLASYESVKKVRIVPGEFTIDGGEITPTLKIRRKIVAQKYGELIEQMYRE